MKIGIDARFLTHPQRGGFKTYTSSLVSALARASADLDQHEYVLYTDRDADVPLDLPSSFRLSPVSGPYPLREQVLLPLRMLVDLIDVAHFPCNTAPLFYRRPMVVTIHDAIAVRTSPNPSSARRGGSKWLGEGHHPSLKGRALQAYWKLVIPRCAERADLVLTDSRAAAGDLRVMLDIPISRMRVVYLGIDPGFRIGDGSVSLEPVSQIRQGERFLMGFAAADGRKNEARAMAAFRRISDGFPGLKLVLVCATPETRARVLDFGHPAIVPVGPVPIEQLRWLYRNARALIFPSLDEGFGLPPLEAMASGTPVVSSRRGSLAEVLGDSAVFIEPDDEQSIAEGMRLILDEKVNHTYRSAGLEHVEQFTWDRMAQDTMRAYWDAANPADA